MREDMAKIIVERPRHNSGRAKGRVRKLQRIPLEEQPLFEGIGRKWSGRSKSLNENLAPLRRFLRSRLGCSWNDVNSEMRERINLRSAVQLHIWQHVEQYVCIHPIVVGGKYIGDWGRRMHQEFYVNPQSGLLLENPDRTCKRDRRVDEPSEYVVIDKWTQCRKIKGNWFCVKLKPLPRDLAATWDVVFKCPCDRVTPRGLWKAYGVEAYAAEKRQMNRKEIMRMLRHSGLRR
jgi:hypothetical protein